MNTFGRLFQLTTWGESHGPAIGGVIDGCPAGLALAEKDIQKDLDRRRPGQSRITTQRKEADKVEILSGVFAGKTTGMPLSLIIYNRDQRLQDYNAIKNLYRPGHADFTFQAKYGLRDYRGGGRQSARETAARVAAGAVAKKLLAAVGVNIYGFTRQVGDIVASNVVRVEIEKNIVRAANKKDGLRMAELIDAVRADGDSVGGVVEVVASGVPAGWGDPVYGKLDALLGGAMMSINAVKGVEIGSGFAGVAMRGSEHNDPFVKKGGRVRTLHNHAGGMLGGISTGEDIVVRIAVKPASSIAKAQATVDKSGRARTIKVAGRHDPCLCPRAVPVAEAMLALVLADAMLASRLSRI